jgi:hypothetical protein
MRALHEACYCSAAAAAAAAGLLQAQYLVLCLLQCLKSQLLNCVYLAPHEKLTYLLLLADGSQVLSAAPIGCAHRFATAATCCSQTLQAALVLTAAALQAGYPAHAAAAAAVAAAPAADSAP